jgi:hypothetical protein
VLPANQEDAVKLPAARPARSRKRVAVPCVGIAKLKNELNCGPLGEILVSTKKRAPIGSPLLYFIFFWLLLTTWPK